MKIFIYNLILLLIMITENNKKRINNIMNLTFIYLTIIVIISTIIVVMDIYNTIHIYYYGKYIASFGQVYGITIFLAPATITTSTIVLLLGFIYSAFDINKVYVYFESNKYNDIIDQTDRYTSAMLILALIVLMGIVMSIYTFGSLMVIFIFKIFFSFIFLLIFMLISYVILRSKLDKNIRKIVTA